LLGIICNTYTNGVLINFSSLTIISLFLSSIEFFLDQSYEQQGGTDHCSSLKSNLIFLLLFH